ncbi:hypothetical protein [Thauera sp. Sel9]|uniref:hypothetical protein n=1 Tax=Thauera sp. Sel9 TaxID=2974299 RepID=UPI0021E17A67|nr:hypothetical protein [Thauera sp. Sel9]MCV2216658.1 hypothetical protein [Thauera sp. Sel9]
MDDLFPVVTPALAVVAAIGSGRLDMTHAALHEGAVMATPQLASVCGILAKLAR